MLGERQGEPQDEHHQGRWVMGLILLQPVGNIVIVSRSHEEDGGLSP